MALEAEVVDSDVLRRRAPGRITFEWGQDDHVYRANLEKDH